MQRTLSYTEISTALTCFAQHDFAYGGRLTGGFTLKPRETAPRLSDGRAWGAGIAAWHASASGEPWGSLGAAVNAMVVSLQDDAREMHQRGFEPDVAAMLEQQERLGSILGHHAATTERLPNLSMLEHELNVPIPSRGGKRGSNKYRFHCYLDGHTIEEGIPGPVEFKLRDNLTPVTIIERQPQYRWYAVAYALTYGIKGPVRVLVDERLNVAPAPARIVNAKRKGEGIDGKTVSHAVNQITTPEIYEAACSEYGVEPDPATSVALAARSWHQQTRLVFTPADLREGAQELITAARIIRDLDSGEHYPIRNGKRSNCQNCRFASICPDPTNGFLVDSLFERTVPKRNRPPREGGQR